MLNDFVQHFFIPLNIKTLSIKEHKITIHPTRSYFFKTIFL